MAYLKILFMDRTRLNTTYYEVSMSPEQISNLSGEFSLRERGENFPVIYFSIGLFWRIALKIVQQWNSAKFFTIFLFETS